MKYISNLSNDVYQLLYKHYCNEVEALKEIPLQSFSSFVESVNEEDLQSVSLVEEDKVLATIFYNKIAGEENSIYIPTFGYGYTSIKYFSMLFQKLLAAEIDKTTTINVNVYVHDEDIKRYLSLTRFGISMETCVRKIKEVPNKNISYPISKLDKIQLKERWQEVWPLLKLMINHLRESPVFWFGDDYTEESYIEFLNEENVSTYVIEDCGRIVGLIESNPEDEGFMLKGDNYNIGEAVVYPEYRGKGLPEALLEYSEKELLKDNVHYSWVMHGTCNPNACGFWDKYFQPYTYSYERKISIPQK